MSRRASTLILALVLSLLAALAAAAEKQPMTNEDVLKMVAAELPDQTIILAIRASEPTFDISASALIELSKAGVGQPILDAMIETQAAAKVAAGGPPASGDAFDPEDVVLEGGGETAPLRYTVPALTQRVRGMGFGGAAVYASLPGSHADLRLKDPRPTFRIAIPENMQTAAQYTLAHLAIRRNGTREILIVNGGMSGARSGVPKDRDVATELEKIDEQQADGKSYGIYRVRPSAALETGEYALIIHVIDKVALRLATNDRYYDFGIDK